MKNHKRIALFIILIGLFIPSVLYPLTSLNSYASSMVTLCAINKTVFITNIRHFELHILNLTISYYKILTVGIVIIFLGLGLLLWEITKPQKGEE